MRCQPPADNALGGHPDDEAVDKVDEKEERVEDAAVLRPESLTYDRRLGGKGAGKRKENGEDPDGEKDLVKFIRWYSFAA